MTQPLIAKQGHRYKLEHMEVLAHPFRPCPHSPQHGAPCAAGHQGGRARSAADCDHDALGRGMLDGDNLQSGCKAARDGVADWLGVDDADPGITWQYAQQKSKRGVHSLIVEVTKP